MYLKDLLTVPLCHFEMEADEADPQLVVVVDLQAPSVQQTSLEVVLAPAATL
jgi:hypothetical protein